MAKNKFIKHIFILLGMVLISEAFGQCNARFVMDIGGGATITDRIKIPYFVDDCVEIFTNTDPPIFLFDSSYVLKDIISIEKDFLLNSSCKQFNVIPKYETCVSELAESNDTKRLKAVRKLICFYDSYDSTFVELQDQLPFIKNEIVKSLIALHLGYSNNPAVLQILKSMAEDTCEYVRLEVGRSLARLGEKEVSYKLLSQIWQIRIYPINVDRFNYFTSSMRNINSPEAIDFLITLSADTNQYCALDASICLLQLGKREEGLNGIKRILHTGDPTIFKASTRALYAYFPTSTLIQLLQCIVQPRQKEIANFKECIIENYGGQHE